MQLQFDVIAVTAPLWVGFLVGVAFGVPAELLGIGNPETLIRVARLVDRLLIGCFAVVTGIGAVVLYGLYAMGVSMHFAPKPLYVYGVALGGLLFGVGMAICGYCPGTELIALAEGRRDVLYAIPGGLLGAAAWTALYETDLGKWLVTTANFGDLIVTGDIKTIDPLLTFAVAVGYAALALTLLALLPRFEGGSGGCLAHLRNRGIDVHDRACMRDTADYLNEGALDPAGTRSASKFQRLAAREVPAPTAYARTIVLIGVALALVAVAAMFLRQIFGQSTTYSWLVGHLFMPDFTYSREVFTNIGWEPLTNVGVFWLFALCRGLVLSGIVSCR
ncbi:MAG: YeeE/YedE family protein [Mycobacterium sp.]|nr:YeeE/YedE family protein [Mycobacterium sp.]